MKRRVLPRQKGMVLVVVVLAIMVMSLVVAGILSRNISSAFVDEKGRQRFQAELLAKGAFWRAYMRQINGLGLPSDFVEVRDGTTYTVNCTTLPGGPGGTTEVRAQVAY